MDESKWKKVLAGLNKELEAVLDQSPGMRGLLTESILLWLMVQQEGMSDLKWVGEENDIDLIGNGHGRNILIEGKYEPATITKKGRPTDVLWGLLKDAIKLAKDTSAAERFLILFVEREKGWNNLSRLENYKGGRDWNYFLGGSEEIRSEGVKKEMMSVDRWKMIEPLIRGGKLCFRITPLLTVPRELENEGDQKIGMLVWSVSRST